MSVKPTAPAEKAVKRAAYLRRRREGLIRAMRRDVRRFKEIIQWKGKP